MSKALTDFMSQLALVDQLIEIHGRLQVGRGRRHQQEALHAAGVVMTVAAWQAYVEKVMAEAIETIAADMNGLATPRWSLHAFNLRRAEIDIQIKRFLTPNDEKVRDLCLELGLNPWPSWAWNQGRRQWTAAQVRERTNVWVRVRHSVAHGFPLPDNIPWLRNEAGQARLTLTLLKECRRHFVHLAQKTDAVFANHLVTQHQMPAPW